MSNGKRKEHLPAKVEEKAVAGSFAGMVLADGASGASGFENVRPEDTAIPFIYVLQSLSPQVKKGHPGRIEGAEEGDLFNNVMQAIVKPPLVVVPCAFQKAYVEWRPREVGGGFVQQHKDETILVQCARNEKNLDVLPNGNHVVPTAYHFILLVNKDGAYERAVLSLTRTQLKKSRRWLSQMMAQLIPDGKGGHVRPPMFAYSYEVSTVMEQKDQYSWFGYVISQPRLLTSEALYLEAKRFHLECVAGAVKVTKPPEDEHGSSDSVNDEAAL